LRRERHWRIQGNITRDPFDNQAILRIDYSGLWFVFTLYLNDELSKTKGEFHDSLSRSSAKLSHLPPIDHEVDPRDPGYVFGSLSNLELEFTTFT
jgi:hypothetical protein